MVFTWLLGYYLLTKLIYYHDFHYSLVVIIFTAQNDIYECFVLLKIFFIGLPTRNAENNPVYNCFMSYLSWSCCQWRTDWRGGSLTSTREKNTHCDFDYGIGILHIIQKISFPSKNYYFSYRPSTSLLQNL